MKEDISYTLPINIYAIYPYAFYGNGFIESVSMANQFTEIIGEYAFFDCSSLASVTFGSRTSVIGKSAFEKTALTSLTVNNRIEIIEERAFFGLDTLTNIYFQPNGSYLVIGEHAFYGAGVPRLILPRHLSSIESYAFGSVVIDELHLKAMVFSRKTPDGDPDITEINSEPVVPFNTVNPGVIIYYPFNAATVNAFYDANWGANTRYVFSPAAYYNMTDTGLYQKVIGLTETGKVQQVIILPKYYNCEEVRMIDMTQETA